MDNTDMQAPFPPRLHVLLARDEPYAVVIRRGPSKHVCVVGWDRRRDSFTVGQWLKGRIYERRSDISPDGKHLIYFASNGIRAWTAISRAPYLKAIGLWTQGDHWNGGGLFQGYATYWLNAVDYQEETKPPGLEQLNSNGKEWALGECLGVYFPRLERDGWVLVRDGKVKGGHVSVFEKRGPNGWTLRKFARASTNQPIGKGCYWDEHELQENGDVLSFPDWEWADFDGKRLVWARNGLLMSGRLTRRGLEDERQLHDFGPMKFERLKAPYD